MKIIVALVLILLLLLPLKAYAQEFHVSVEPTVLYIDTTPPSSPEAPFIVKNLANTSIKLTPRLIPFEAEEDGKIKLLINNQNDLSSFIKARLVIIDENGLINELDLRPGEAKQLKLGINLEPGDPVGDYYFTLVFMSEGEILDETTTSAIPAGIGINVMLSIGPKIDASAEIEEFSARSFIDSGPVDFSLKVKNNGEHLIQPKGFISIKNMFGKEVGKLDILPQYLLSNSSRFLIDDSQASPSAEIENIIAELEPENPVAIWKEKFLMGRYSATARLTLEDGSAVITSTTHFTAIPLQIVAIISGLIFIVLGLALRISIKIKRKAI